MKSVREKAKDEEQEKDQILNSFSDYNFQNQPEFLVYLIKISPYLIQMADEKNEIEQLIDNMINSGDELVGNLKTILPNSLAESMLMFHESNVTNLKKIKDFLNKQTQSIDSNDCYYIFFNHRLIFLMCLDLEPSPLL